MQDTYRTKDGHAYFEFRFVNKKSHYEIDILSTPSYGMRSRSPHKTHRLSSRRGGDRICVGDDSSVKTLPQAKKIAQAWSEQTWRYINTGKPFAGK
jgi:hypothetical protein